MLCFHFCSLVSPPPDRELVITCGRWPGLALQLYPCCLLATLPDPIVVSCPLQGCDGGSVVLIERGAVVTGVQADPSQLCGSTLHLHVGHVVLISEALM